jgi:hypothetical protein
MLLPGILAALLLVLVRTVAMFELTFLTAGPTSQTLVVALYYSVFASGVRAAFCQSDADRSPRQTAADHRLEHYIVAPICQGTNSASP